MPKIVLQTELQTDPAAITIDALTDNGFAVALDQRVGAFDIVWRSASEGWIRNHDTGRMDAFYWWQTPEDSAKIWLSGRILTLSRPAPSQARSRQTATSEFEAKILAPMPGTILQVLAASGETVPAQTPLLIMESMKMEITLSSPTEARIRTVHAQVGQLVEMQTLLIELEPVVPVP